MSRVQEEKEPETLSVGILDSLFMAETNQESKTFDDSERRERARINQSHRELEVDSIIINHA